jgi:hypothetical protein
MAINPNETDAQQEPRLAGPFHVTSPVSVDVCWLNVFYFFANSH